MGGQSTPPPIANNEICPTPTSRITYMDEFYKQINIEPKKFATLGQISGIVTMLQETEQIQKMVKIDNAFKLLTVANGGKGITDKQRGYLLYLLSSKLWRKLANFLVGINFSPAEPKPVGIVELVNEVDNYLNNKNL